jgi:hypothetical protein
MAITLKTPPGSLQQEAVDVHFKRSAKTPRTRSARASARRAQSPWLRVELLRGGANQFPGGGCTR